MREVGQRLLRLLGTAAVLTLPAAPTSAVTQEQRTATPVTVPALTDWTSAQGSYAFGSGTRLVASDAAGRRVADTLADDLRAAGHGVVPVATGAASRPGDVVIDVRPSARSTLGTEGHELAPPVRARRWRARITGARAEPRLAEFGLYRSAVRPDDTTDMSPQVERQQGLDT
ncbi:glycoside hydrolase family 20 zincin-like fold domain-containing protein [Streptomyces sp. NPDC001714]|uniref:glycoside hydrolase family 20 zincin-like fold domain-containing protein n=1 Tax=Streptomyces sp. NPDC001714 TaxID=3364603 RepID=UPI00367543AA